MVNLTKYWGCTIFIVLSCVQYEGCSITEHATLAEAEAEMKERIDNNCMGDMYYVRILKADVIAEQTFTVY